MGVFKSFAFEFVVKVQHTAQRPCRHTIMAKRLPWNLVSPVVLGAKSWKI